MSPLRVLLPLASALLLAETAFSQAPANDNFADRIDLGSVLPVTAMGTTVGSTAERGEQLEFGTDGSIWYSWKAPSEGLFFATTQASSSYAKLQVYRGEALENLARDGSEDQFHSYASDALAFHAVLDEVVMIRVFNPSIGDDRGEVQLDISRDERPYVSAVAFDPPSIEIGVGEPVAAVVTFSVVSPIQFEELRASIFDTRNAHAGSATIYGGDPSSAIQLLSQEGDVSTYRAEIQLSKPYSAGGDWPLTIELYAGGMQSVIPEEVPYPTGVDYTLTVTNGGLVDRDRPTITGLTISPAKIDTAAVDQEISFQVTATDDVAVSSAAVSFRRRGSSTKIFRKYVPGGTTPEGIFEGTITIPAGTTAGELFPIVEVRDVVNNSAELTGGYSSPRLPPGFTRAVSIENATSENQPPVLTSFTLSENAVDITEESASVLIHAEASDVAGDVFSVIVELGVPGREVSLNIRKDTDSPGVFEKEWTIPRYLIAGNHPLTVTVTGQETSGTYSAENRSFPPGATESLTVINTGAADIAPPVLTGVTMTPTSVDVSDAAQEIQVRIEVVDDIGLAGLGISLRNPDAPPPTIYDDAPIAASLGLSVEPISKDGDTAVYEGVLTIPRGTLSGDLLASVWMRDLGLNWVSYRYGGEEEFPEGADTVVSVINNGPINGPPELVSMTLNPDPVDITTGEQEVSVLLKITDVTDEIFPDSILFEIPGITKQRVYISGVTDSGEYFMKLYVPRYLASGEYPISIEFYDDSGAWASHGPGASPFPVGIDGALTVINTGYVDMEPPAITALEITPGQIDVSVESQAVSFRVTATDDAEVTDLDFWFQRPGSSERIVSSWRGQERRVSGDVRSGVYEVALTVPGQSTAGLLVPFVRVVDSRGNSSVYSGQPTGDQLPFPGNPLSEVTVVNTAGENTPPVLHSLTIDPSPADLTDGGRRITITASATDDFYRINSFSVSADISGKRVSTSLHTRDSDTPDIFTGTIDLPDLVPPGSYPLFVTIREASGQTSSYGGTNSSALPFPEGAQDSIAIENNGVTDFTAPAFSAITITPSSVDVTDSAQDVILQITAADDTALTGFFLKAPFASRQDMTPHRISGDESEGTYEVLITIPPHIAAGPADISVTATDIYGRRSEEDLSGLLEVINTGPVDTRPTLTSFEFEIDSIDVAGQTQDVIITVDAADDYGIDSIVLELFQTRDDDPWYGDRIGVIDPEFTLISGDATDGTYEFVVKLPSYITPMTIKAGVQLVDSLGQWASFGVFSGGIGLFDPELVVTNSGSTEPPTILTGLTLSPSPVDLSEDEQDVAVKIETSSSGSDIDFIHFHIPSAGISRGLDYNHGNYADLVESSRGTFEGRLRIPRNVGTGSYPVILTITPRSDLDSNLEFYYIPIENTIVYGGDSGDEFPNGAMAFLNVLNNGPIDVEPPRLTSLSLSPSRVDVTNGDQEIVFSMGVSDDYKVDYANLSLSFEGKSSEIYWHSFHAPDLGTSQEGIYSGTLEIPGHLEPGTLRASVDLRDEFGRRSTFTAGSQEDPMPDGILGTIEVINRGAIDTPPVLHSLTFQETEVDVSSGAKVVEVLATASDDFSFVSRIDIQFKKASDFGPAVSLYPLSAGSEGSLRGYLLLPTSTQPGVYEATASLYASGTSGAGRTRYGGVSDLPFPSGADTGLTITNSSVTALKPRPELVGLSYSEDIIDVTSGSQTVAVQIEAMDVHGIEEIELSLRQESGTLRDQILVNITDAERISGTAVAGIYEVEFIVPRSYPAGPLLPNLKISGVSGSNATFGERFAFPEGEYRVLSIRNSGAINRPPTVVSLSRGTEVVSLTDGATGIPIVLGITDDYGEIEHIGLSASIGDYSFSADPSGWQETAEGTFFQNLSIPEGSPAGDYLFEVFIRDSDGFDEHYGGRKSYAEPLPLGVDTGFTLINEGEVDSAPPEVFALTFHPNPVSRDRLPVNIEVAIGATDSQAGIRGGSIYMANTPDGIYVHDPVFFGQEELQAGDPKAAVFMFDLDINALPESPRLYSRIYISDRLGLQRQYRDYRSPFSEYPEGTEPLMIVDSYNDSYDAWVSAHAEIPAPLTSPAADADGDGFANGTEFFLGMEPMLDSNATPQVPEIVMENGQFGLRVPVAEENLQMAGRTVNATPKAQWSRDGQSWRDIPAPEIVDGMMTYLTPVDAGGVKLMRFVVEFAPPLEMN